MSGERASSENDPPMFDLDDPKLDKSRPLKVVKEQNMDYINLRETILPERNQIRSMVLEIRRTALGSTSNEMCETDPLSDTKYTHYHALRTKQEARMLQYDLRQGESEADTLRTILEKLSMPQWQKTLPRVVKIDNLDDQQELQLKRRKAIKHIECLLAEFDHMKLRIRQLSAKSHQRTRTSWQELYQPRDTRLIQDYSSSSESDDEKMDNETLILRRTAQIHKKCGRTLILGTSSPNLKKVIISKPLRKPYVTQASENEMTVFKDSAINVTLLYRKQHKYGRQAARKMSYSAFPVTLKSTHEDSKRNDNGIGVYSSGMAQQKPMD